MPPCQASFCKVHIKSEELPIYQNHLQIGGLWPMYYCTCAKLWTKTIKTQISTFASGEPIINQYNKLCWGFLIISPQWEGHLCLIWCSRWRRIPFLMYWPHSCPQNCLSYFADRALGKDVIWLARFLSEDFHKINASFFPNLSSSWSLAKNFWSQCLQTLTDFNKGNFN